MTHLSSDAEIEWLSAEATLVGASQDEEDHHVHRNVSMGKGASWSSYLGSAVTTRPTYLPQSTCLAGWVATSVDPVFLRITGSGEVRTDTVFSTYSKKSYRSILNAILIVQHTDKQIPKWLQDLQGLDDAEVSQEDLSEIVKQLNVLFAEKDFESVSNILGGVDPSEFAIKILLTLARGTFKARPALPNWKSATQMFKAEVASRGVNADSLFKGL